MLLLSHLTIQLSCLLKKLVSHPPDCQQGCHFCPTNLQAFRQNLRKVLSCLISYSRRFIHLASFYNSHLVTYSSFVVKKGVHLCLRLIHTTGPL
jgi:hypothetical protein